MARTGTPPREKTRVYRTGRPDRLCSLLFAVAALILCAGIGAATTILPSAASSVTVAISSSPPSARSISSASACSAAVGRVPCHSCQSTAPMPAHKISAGFCVYF